MKREEMVRRSQMTGYPSSIVSSLRGALGAALRELSSVGDALGTDKTGDGLVGVARKAHEAEQMNAMAMTKLHNDFAVPPVAVPPVTVVPDVPTESSDGVRSASYALCKCGVECSSLQDSTAEEPCWGEVRGVDDIYMVGWVHRCKGHAPVSDGKAYRPETPVEVPDDPEPETGDDLLSRGGTTDGGVFRSASYTLCACGGECGALEMSTVEEPCWGEVEAVDEIEDSSEDEWTWVHRCQGHARKYSDLGAGYNAEPSVS